MKITIPLFILLCTTPSIYAQKIENSAIIGSWELKAKVIFNESQVDTIPIKSEQQLEIKSDRTFIKKASTEYIPGGWELVDSLSSQNKRQTFLKTGTHLGALAGIYSYSRIASSSENQLILEEVLPSEMRSRIHYIYTNLNPKLPYKNNDRHLLIDKITLDNFVAQIIKAMQLQEPDYLDTILFKKDDFYKYYSQTIKDETRLENLKKDLKNITYDGLLNNRVVKSDFEGMERKFWRDYYKAFKWNIIKKTYVFIKPTTLEKSKKANRYDLIIGFTDQLTYGVISVEGCVFLNDAFKLLDGNVRSATFSSSEAHSKWQQKMIPLERKQLQKLIKHISNK